MHAEHCTPLFRLLALAIRCTNTRSSPTPTHPYYGHGQRNHRQNREYIESKQEEFLVAAAAAAEAVASIMMGLRQEEVDAIYRASRKGRLAVYTGALLDSCRLGAMLVGATCLALACCQVFCASIGVTGRKTWSTWHRVGGGGGGTRNFPSSGPAPPPPHSTSSVDKTEAFLSTSHEEHTMEFPRAKVCDENLQTH